MEGVKDGYRGELKRWETAAQWVKDDWPQIDTGHDSACVYRLEDGQGEHRLFEAPTLFTGEKMEDMRDRQRLRIAELEELVRYINSNHDHDKDAHRHKTLCYVWEAEKLLPKKEGPNA